MKEHIKTKWLEALRSGEYQQGKYRLKRNNKYCCLGVLTDLHRKTKKKKDCKWIKLADGDESYFNSIGALNIKVQKWSGIDSAGGFFKYPTNNKTNTLASLNDTGKSFKQIADIIEKYF
jgi:hypothetical protein